MKTPTDPNQPILFFWIQEEGESYAAHDKESARAYWMELTGDEIPEFTEENRGEDWDEVSPETVLYDEDRVTVLGTFREVASKFSHLPFEITTTYA